MVPDPVRLEVFQQLLAAICEESGALLQRTALSPNIRERRDFSCALFDAEARLVAQAAHIPVHLGSAADSVRAVQEQLELEPGDVVLLNDPYRGGTHLPDLSMVLPVFLAGDEAPDFFLVNRAHHADVGGATPGSMGVAVDLIAEGTVIPPVKIRVAGQTNGDVLRLLLANMRSAEERRVDLQAQEAALQRAALRLRELVDVEGLDVTRSYCAHLMDYVEGLAAAALRRVPPGSFVAEEFMEDDGRGQGPFRLHLELRRRGRRLCFDFRGSDDQAQGGINANRSIVLAACVYALRCICPGRMPTNEGLFRCLELRTRRGSLLGPIHPAPVAGGNVETSQRLVDLCFAALGQALPQRLPAQSAGTMSSLAMGGAAADGGQFAFYETLPGGAGAGPLRAGAAALQTHMTNTRNTPVEEMERSYPLRICRLELRRGSSGGGARRGGEGLRKVLQVLVPVHASLFAERHRQGPAGSEGGTAGRAGAAAWRRRGRWRRLLPKQSLQLEAGDELRIETPGGGGHGRVG